MCVCGGGGYFFGPLKNDYFYGSYFYEIGTVFNILRKFCIFLGCVIEITGIFGGPSDQAVSFGVQS